MKKLSFIQKTQSSHWVGDGFPVRNIFSYRDIPHEMSPFLLLDYAGPANFSPTKSKRGVGEHPHRGFETVTLVYEGEVEHRDSAGGGGKIGPGDVQWMTAASGLVHEEYHGSAYAQRGGLFEVIQLWVNLPKKDKMTDPRYQGILNSSIPVVSLGKELGTVRIIAGEYEGKKGPAQTFTPMQVWDVQLKAGQKISFSVCDGDTASFFVRRGLITLPSGEVIRDSELAVFDRAGNELTFEATQDTAFLFLSGTPLNEPVVGHGPFVMNTDAEIRQALLDYQSGKMGHLR
jgi:redox-sensitive bicupin YhaK (pirin superfamily)